MFVPCTLCKKLMHFDDRRIRNSHDYHRSCVWHIAYLRMLDNFFWCVKDAKFCVRICPNQMQLGMFALAASSIILLNQNQTFVKSSSLLSITGMSSSKYCSKSILYQNNLWCAGSCKYNLWSIVLFLILLVDVDRLWI